MVSNKKEKWIRILTTSLNRAKELDAKKEGEQ